MSRILFPRSCHNCWAIILAQTLLEHTVWWLIGGKKGGMERKKHILGWEYSLATSVCYPAFTRLWVCICLPLLGTCTGDSQLPYDGAMWRGLCAHRLTRKGLFLQISLYPESNLSPRSSQSHLGTSSLSLTPEIFIVGVFFSDSVKISNSNRLWVCDLLASASRVLGSQLCATMSCLLFQAADFGAIQCDTYQ